MFGPARAVLGCPLSWPPIIQTQGQQLVPKAGNSVFCTEGGLWDLYFTYGELKHKDFFMTGKYPALCALEVCGQECLIPCSEKTGKKSLRGRSIISQETVSNYPRGMFSLVGSGRT